MFCPRRREEGKISTTGNKEAQVDALLVSLELERRNFGDGVHDGSARLFQGFIS